MWLAYSFSLKFQWFVLSFLTSWHSHTWCNQITGCHQTTEAPDACWPPWSLSVSFYGVFQNYYQRKLYPFWGCLIRPFHYPSISPLFWLFYNIKMIKVSLLWTWSHDSSLALKMDLGEVSHRKIDFVPLPNGCFAWVFLLCAHRGD